MQKFLQERGREETGTGRNPNHPNKRDITQADVHSVNIHRSQARNPPVVFNLNSLARYVALFVVVVSAPLLIHLAVCTTPECSTHDHRCIYAGAHAADVHAWCDCRCAQAHGRLQLVTQPPTTGAVTRHSLRVQAPVGLTMPMASSWTPPLGHLLLALAAILLVSPMGVLSTPADTCLEQSRCLR